MSAKSKTSFFRSLAAVRAPLALACLAASAAAQAIPTTPLVLGDQPTLTLEQGATAPASGSAPADFTTVGLGRDFSRVHHDESADGVLWARGKSYKASFAPDGSTYIPFLGSDAPRSFPVEMSLRSISAGGHDLWFDSTAAAQREGDTVTFERGSVREVYDLGVESVEQSFDLDARGGDGDLVVKLRFETELTASATDSGLSFSNELGRVDYSRAVAIDANGEELDLATELADDGTIAITVPDGWLDSAAFPLRIDPTFTTHSVSLTPQAQYHTDVAFDHTTGRTTVVWEETYSDSDHDVAFAVVDSGTVFYTGYVDITADYWSEPRVGHITSALRAMTVATKGPPGSMTQIWGRTTNMDGHTVSGQFRIDLGADATNNQPDVGGDNTWDQSHTLCVIWRRQIASNVWRLALRRVAIDGSLVGTTFAEINSAIARDHNPRVSDTHDGSRWSIVWQRTTDGVNNNVHVARVSLDFETSESGVIANSPDNELNPSVSSHLLGSQRYMVVFERRAANNSNVIGVLMNGTSGEGGVDITANVGSGASDTIEPVVATDGRHYTIVWRDATLGRLEATEMWCTQSPFGVGLTEGPVQIATLPEIAAQVAGRWSTGAPVGQRSLACVYTQSQDVKLALMQNRIGGTAYPACYGDGTGSPCPCGNSGAIGRGCANSVNASGARLTSSGSPGLGSEDTLALIGSGMPPGVACLYFQGSGLFVDGFAFGDGLRCAAGTVVRLGTKMNDASGNSQYPTAGDQPISIRGGIAPGGGSAGYQAWYRNAASYCTSSTFNLTNGYYVQFAP